MITYMNLQQSQPGYTAEKVLGNPHLKCGFEKAVTEVDRFVEEREKRKGDD